MTIHRTLPTEAYFHESGRFTLPSGIEVTKLSLIDTKQRLPDGTPLFARLSYKDAKAFAEAHGGRLLSPETIREIRDVGLHVEPVTINPDSTELSASIDHDTRFWNHNTVTNTAGLRELNWDGNVPVCGAGKWWQDGAPPGRAYLMGWWTKFLGRFSKDRSGAGFVQEADHDEGRHNEDMFDYGTLTMIEWGTRSSPSIPPPSSKGPASMPPDTQPARTHPGDHGPAVTAWQLWLQQHGYSIGVADGIHGPRTEAASLAYERASRPSAPPPSGPGVVDIEFIQAKNYTPANRTRIDWVVLHSTENPIAPGVANSIAMWFGGTSAPQASSHYIVGCETVIQCVKETDVAWAAPNANRTGIQVEQVGQAALTDWARAGDDTRAGRAVLERSAELVAAICRRWSLPIVRVDVAGLLAGQRGITTHASVSAAFHGSDHQDPGLQGDRRWPWEDFLQLVSAAA